MALTDSTYVTVEWLTKTDNHADS